MPTDRSKPSFRTAPCASARSPSCARISRATRRTADPTTGALRALRRRSCARSRLVCALARRKRQRDAVDAIARAGGFRSVGEDMAEMRIARCATNLGAAHEPRAILVLAHGARLGRRPEARPTGAGIEFGIRRKERRTAAHALEHAVALFAVERMREGGLGAVLAGDPVLLGREQLSPLFVGLGDFSRAAIHGACFSVR